MWVVAKGYLAHLRAQMQAERPVDIDMWMMFRVDALNNHVYCSSQSMAGQDEHFSDCLVEGKFFKAWKVAAPVVDELMPVLL